MMYVFVVTVACIILYSLMLYIDTKRKQYTKGEDVLALDLTPEELYKVLNFMLMYGIIDFTQYTQIELKSLPYVKG